MAYGPDITSGQTYNQSSYYDSDPTYNGAKCFDDDVSGTYWNSATDSVTNQWVSVQWGTGKIVTKIRIIPVSIYAPDHCILQGSNNGSDWTKISATGWDGTYLIQYNTDEFQFDHVTNNWGWVTFNNSTAYTYYRVFMTDGQHASWIALSEIEMMATVYTLAIGAGSYVLTGQAASPLYNRIFSIGAGSYTLSGQVVNTLYNRILSVDAGSYTLTGQIVVLIEPLALLLSSKITDSLARESAITDSLSLTSKITDGLSKKSAITDSLSLTSKITDVLPLTSGREN